MKNLLIGTGALGLVMAAAEAAPPELVAKATPTPWEAIIAGSIAVSTFVIRKYTAPETKLDEHNSAIQTKLEMLISQNQSTSVSDMKWKLDTSHVLGSIITRQEDQGERLKTLEAASRQILENRK